MAGATNLPDLHWGRSVVLPAGYYSQDRPGVLGAYAELVNASSLWIVESSGSNFVEIRPKMIADGAAADSLVPDMRIIIGCYPSQRYEGASYLSTHWYLGICPDCAGNSLVSYDSADPYGTGRWSKFVYGGAFTKMEELFIIYSEEILCLCAADYTNNYHYCAMAGALADPLHADAGEDTYAGQGAPLEGIYRRYGLAGNHRDNGLAQVEFWDVAEAWPGHAGGTTTADGPHFGIFLPGAAAMTCSRKVIEGGFGITHPKGELIGYYSGAFIGVPFHWREQYGGSGTPYQYMGMGRGMRMWGDRAGRLELKDIGGAVKALLLNCRPTSTVDTIAFVNP